MMCVLRLTRANRRTFPQVHHLVAYTFILSLALLVSLLKKKITHPYPFRFLLPCQSTLRLPVLDADTHSPRCYHVAHLSLLAHAPSRVPLAPPIAWATRSLPSRALVLVMLALPVTRAAPSRTKPGASGGGARARRWCGC